MSNKRTAAEKDSILWKESDAKKILITDLHTGALQIGESGDEVQEEKEIEEAWEFYQHLHEFRDVPWEQFRDQIKKHRSTVRSKVQDSCDQGEALEHDMALSPRREHYPDGQRIFRLTPAYEQLRKDVAAGLHHSMTPAALRAHRFELYGSWDLGVFSQRIYQSERQWKFMNYLEKKRKEKYYADAIANELESNFQQHGPTPAPSKKIRTEKK